ncbi:hypothetical protein HELRODRAFT_175721 [Helobdella robusta]|uniref:Uncharacterized protein n=1 Tax=Helobdella robusta TaxID=6412 RepID=T1F9K4_HELRO|nr:hypothetical protein HELRODRAFT_175721 [Helobdella robusta]ESO00730.1 hypothetical protein HELRODRAFT_175721 [Helobdella robusta]
MLGWSDDYITGFKEREKKEKLSLYKKFAEDNLDKYEVPAEEFQKLVELLALGTDLMPDEEPLMLLTSVTTDQLHNLMMDQQNFFFTKIVENIPKNYVSKLHLDSDGVDGIINHTDYFPLCYRVQKNYFLPYRIGEFLDKICPICREDFIERSFVVTLFIYEIAEFRRVMYDYHTLVDKRVAARGQLNIDTHHTVWNLNVDRRQRP